MAEKENLTFLGSLPVDTELVTLLDAAEGSKKDDAAAETSPEDSQKDFMLLRRYKKTSSWPLFRTIVEHAIGSLLLTDASAS